MAPRANVFYVVPRCKTTVVDGKAPRQLTSAGHGQLTMHASNGSTIQEGLCVDTTKLEFHHSPLGSCTRLLNLLRDAAWRSQHRTTSCVCKGQRVTMLPRQVLDDHQSHESIAARVEALMPQQPTFTRAPPQRPTQVVRLDLCTR
jgi:hypothetical protein